MSEIVCTAAYADCVWTARECFCIPHSMRWFERLFARRRGSSLAPTRPRDRRRVGMAPACGMGEPLRKTRIDKAGLLAERTRCGAFFIAHAGKAIGRHRDSRRAYRSNDFGPSITDQRGAPGEAATEGFQQQQLSALDTAGTD